MKTLLLFFLLFSLHAYAQITSPVIKAAFGVDADLRSNYFNGFVQSGNDDWFNNGTLGTGQFVIDTTGAAFIKNKYASDVAPYPYRMSSFYRGMSKPPYSIVNNRMWLDALFIRDYHGNDTTVFTAGGDKNGMSPVLWSGGIQGIPDKNDILDVFMHVRRAGPTTSDSLWMFGGLSLDNVTGNRYFDFEMYQTDIYYDRASSKWYGYGPDAGHTSWKFDAAGNVIKPGDIIFSASYQSASLTNIEARIWIDKSSLGITPAAFSWSGQFDGDGNGAQYGYASILPKNAGAFYTGLQCGNGEWAGAFSLILQDNSVATNYTAKQFMEFSVNLTKLGLDPVTIFGSDICGTPFNRLVVKTRASESFTSELKDFVAPIDLFLAPRVNVFADVPYFCGINAVSNLQVQNPSSSSVYTWTTSNGHIAGSNTGTSIYVDAPGTYIVTQQLAAGCGAYAYDTITIAFDPSCTVMANTITQFSGRIQSGFAQLNWTTKENNETRFFEIQRSTNGKDFVSIDEIQTNITDNSIGEYFWKEPLPSASPFIYYRLKAKMKSGATIYSTIVRLALQVKDEALIFPNPANDQVQLSISSDKRQELKLIVFDVTGKIIDSKELQLRTGSNLFSLETLKWKEGTYVIQLSTSGQSIYKKLLVDH